MAAGFAAAADADSLMLLAMQPPRPPSALEEQRQQRLLEELRQQQHEQQQPAPRLGSWAFDRHWQTHERTCHRYAPEDISFHLWTAMGRESFEATVEVVARESVLEDNSFYVGATQDPLRRWKGDPWAERAMEGHQQRGYDHMHVIALKRTWEARRLEKRLIIHARGIFGKHRCANKSEDARGQAEGDNFIYVVVRTL